MLHRQATNAQKLDVAGLNEITVLVDRSETELTEVALNSWTPGLDGPPHAHDQKEQNFFVTAGTGLVKIGSESFPAQPGDFFYVPAGTVHQTVNQGQDRLEYFLFNAFLDASKEGHASFADHISKVKETRRSQAAQQRADVKGESAATATRPGKHVRVGDSTPSPTTLVRRDEAQRSEAVYYSLHAREQATLHDITKEQTVFILSGPGTCTAGEGATPVSVQPRDVLYVKRGEKAVLVGGPGGLRAISFGTVVRR